MKVLKIIYLWRMWNFHVSRRSFNTQKSEPDLNILKLEGDSRWNRSFLLFDDFRLEERSSW